MNANELIARAWITTAYRQVRHAWPFWLIATGIYLMLAKLLLRLPFVGFEFIILLTPMIATGALQEAAHPTQDQGLLTRLRHFFMRAIPTGARALPMIMMGTVTLGAWVFLTVLMLLSGLGGTSLTGLFAGPGFFAPIGVMIGLLFFWVIRIALVLTILYALAGIALDALAPIDAIETALSLWRSPKPLFVVGATFVLPCIIAAYLNSATLLAVSLLTLAPFIHCVALSFTPLRSAATRPTAAVR